MSMEERAVQSITRLAELAETAEKGREAAQPILNLASAFGQVARLDTLGEAEKLATVDALVKVGIEVGALASVVGQAREIADALSKVTGSDRQEGDALSKSLTLAIESGFLEGDVRERAEKVVSAWTSSAPKRKGRTPGSSANAPAGKALPFPVTVKCESHGWTATQSTNANSLRWAAILHHESAHGGTRPAKGDPIHTGLTEAIAAVVDGAAAGDGGGYLVTRAVSA